jgi:hypothetical protein
MQETVIAQMIVDIRDEDRERDPPPQFFRVGLRCAAPFIRSTSPAAALGPQPLDVEQ